MRLESHAISLTSPDYTVDGKQQIPALSCFDTKMSSLGQQNFKNGPHSVPASTSPVLFIILTVIVLPNCINETNTHIQLNVFVLT